MHRECPVDARESLRLPTFAYADRGEGCGGNALQAARTPA
jgi:hypothetical protein